MKGNEFLDKMDLINDEYIEVADNEQAIRHSVKWQPVAVAACMMIAVGALITFNHFSNDTNSSGELKQAQNDVTITTIDHASTNEESNEIEDLSPIKYSKINLCQGGDADYGDVSSGYELSVMGFKESLLENCKDKGMIVEGTVTNIYTKEYKFDVYNDKFEKDGILHNIENTVVYEVKIAKLWYGEYKEDIILIEDYNYFLDPVWELKVGRKYVFPIAYEGDKIYEANWDDFKEGDCERDSVYCSVYPYHEPIEVTLDGDYLVSSNWPTLIEENAREIIMDVEGYESIHDMYMISGKSFQKNMNKLIKKTIANN